MFYLAQVISVWNCIVPSSSWAFSRILLRSSPLRTWNGWTSACFPRPTAACSHCTRTVSRIPWGSCGGRPGWANSNHSGLQTRDDFTTDFYVVFTLFSLFFNAILSVQSFFYLFNFIFEDIKKNPINASKVLPRHQNACHMPTPFKFPRTEWKRVNQPNHALTILSLFRDFKNNWFQYKADFLGVLCLESVIKWIWRKEGKKNSKMSFLDQLNENVTPIFWM